MIIRGSLSGTDVHLQFYGPDDLGKSGYGSEIQPENWVQLTLPEDEARALFGWLQGNRATDYRSSRLTVRGAGGSLIIEGAGSTFVIRLGTSEMVASLTREISGALSLIIGRPVDPSVSNG